LVEAPELDEWPVAPDRDLVLELVDLAEDALDHEKNPEAPGSVPPALSTLVANVLPTEALSLHVLPPESCARLASNLVTASRTHASATSVLSRIVSAPASATLVSVSERGTLEIPELRLQTSYLVPELRDLRLHCAKAIGGDHLHLVMALVHDLEVGVEPTEHAFDAAVAHGL
jgi:hypothetical protein